MNDSRLARTGWIALVLAACFTIVLPAQDAVRQGPRPLKAAAVGVGRWIPDQEFTDINGTPHRLSDYASQSALVIALTGTSCPLNLKYAATLAALEDEYGAKGIAFVFCDPTESDTDDQIKQAIQQHGLTGAYVADRDQQLSAALGATTTTEVFVLDSRRTLIYRGAVDDQYGLGFALDAPRKTFLRDALDALLAGGVPSMGATTAPGCELGIEPGSDSGELTYYNRISRIVQDRCADCHRAQGLGPFALTSLDELKAHAGMVRYVVEQDLMPPWFAAEQETDAAEDQASIPTRRWANDRSLSKEEKRDLLNWLDSDQPVGDESNAPLPRSFSKDWKIGKPDVVFQIPQPMPVKANGQMPYKHVRIETEFSEDKWIQAVEIRPTAPAVVHHVLVFAITDESGRGDLDERSGFLAAYVPGNSSQVYPPGFAKYVPAGAKLVFQLHYTPIGTATEDQTEFAIKFAAQPPQYVVRNFGIANGRISIPAGADNHAEEEKLPVASDVELLAFMPHMHLRGKAFRYELIGPDGEKQILLDVPRYDFNWQLEYRLLEPQSVPADSQLKVTGWFDNSSGNPANPDPTKVIKWGPQTDDEMLIGYVEYFSRSETPESVLQAKKAEVDADSAGSGRIDRMFRQADKDGDGRVTAEELNQPALFKRLDQDQDGGITLEEARSGLGKGR